MSDLPTLNEIIEIKRGDEWVEAKVLELEPRFLVWIIGSMGVMQMPLREDKEISDQWRLKHDPARLSTSDP